MVASRCDACLAPLVLFLWLSMLSTIRLSFPYLSFFGFSRFLHFPRISIRFYPRRIFLKTLRILPRSPFYSNILRIVRNLANSQHFLRCKCDASVEQTPRFPPSVIRDFTRENLTLLPSCANPFPPHPSFPPFVLPDSLARDLHSRLIIKVWRHRVFSINIPG